MMMNWFKTVLAATAFALVSACGGSDDHPPPPPGTLAQVATANGFTALVAAATKANLVPALSDSTSNFTVFAPTDAAFNTMATALGFADATAMVAALDATTLQKVLQYHVLPTKKLAADLQAAGATSTQATLYNFEGAATTLDVNTTSGVKITDEVLVQATVTTANVPASNGVMIHIIDRVLVPPGVLNAVQMAQLNPAFSVLVEAVVAANLATTLSGVGPFTVFAPTNDAFTAALTELTLTKAQLLASRALRES
jgi:transforming growth factor-beta-induced protein